MGLDIDLGAWRWQVFAAGLFIIILTLLVVLALVVGRILLRYREDRQYASHRGLRHLEVAMMAIIGALVTIAIGHQVHEHERQTHHRFLDLLTTSRAQEVGEAVERVVRVDLKGFIQAVAIHGVPDDADFERYAEHLLASSAAAGWVWLPGRAGNQATEMRVRMQASLAAPPAEQLQQALEQAMSDLSPTTPMVSVASAALPGYVLVVRRLGSGSHGSGGVIAALIHPRSLVEHVAQDWQTVTGISDVATDLLALSEADEARSLGGWGGALSESLPMAQRPIFLGGTICLVRAQATPQLRTFQDRTGAVVVWLGGSINTLLVMLLVHVLGGRSRLLQQVVAERTTALRNSEQRLNATLYSIGDGVISTDTDCRVVDMNAVAEALTGWSLDQARGLRLGEVFSIIDGRSAGPSDDASGQTLAGDAVATMSRQGVLQHRDGSRRIIAESVAPIHSHGEVIGMVLVFRDISARIHDEQQLRHRLAMEAVLSRFSLSCIVNDQGAIDAALDEALAQIGALVDAGRCGVFRIDVEAGTMSNTHEWCAPGILSHKADNQEMDLAPLTWWVAALRDMQVIDIPRRDVLPPEAEAVRAILQAQGICSLLAVPLLIDGPPIGFVAFATVAGDRDWSEDDRSILTTFAYSLSMVVARQRSAAQVQSMEAQLLQAHKMESVGQLAAGIAHEINTPTQFIGDNLRFLNESIGELLELLACTRSWNDGRQGTGAEALAATVAERLERIDADFLSDEIPQAIDQSLEGVRRVATIVGAMKDFSHGSIAAVEMQAADLNRAIESTITVARNEWRYVADVVLNLDPELPLVTCVLGEINQVVLNLVINAAHAIRDKVGADPALKGRIDVSTHGSEETVDIRIGDNGQGIAAEHRARIFDPFFTTKEVGKGTGQGLHLAYQTVVNRHRGSIDFTTEVGVGTTFIITLPRS